MAQSIVMSVVHRTEQVQCENTGTHGFFAIVGLSWRLQLDAASARIATATVRFEMMVTTRTI